MNLLQSILGGAQQQQDYQDFIQRYDRGAPWEGISDREALERYQQVAPQLPPGMYQDSSEQAFRQLTPQQRLEFGRYLQRQAPQYGFGGQDLNGDGIEDRFQDPAYLSQVTGRMHEQQPGLLGQVLGGALGGGGGGAGSLLSSPIAKAALAGIAAVAAQRYLGSGKSGGLL